MHGLKTYMSLLKKAVRDNFRKVCNCRDNWRCAKCKTETRGIEVHHITDRHCFKNGGYVKENGITLCDECHLLAEKYHQTNGNEWNEGFHPNDLYEIIKSNYIEAVKADQKYD